MKSLMIFALGLVGLVLLAIGAERREEKSNTNPVQPPPSPRQLIAPERMEYVTFDDHEYVRYWNGQGSYSLSGIAHSPKCPCHQTNNP